MLFGIDNQMAIIVPAGDYGREAKLISEVEELSRTVSITGLANIKATDEYYLTSELTPRQFAELADLDYEVAQVLYTGYAMDINEYGQVVTNLENYAVPLLDMFCYLCDKRDEVEVNIPADTEELLDELEQQINDAKLQLKSDNWSRIVLYADIPTEGRGTAITTSRLSTAPPHATTTKPTSSAIRRAARICAPRLKRITC